MAPVYILMVFISISAFYAAVEIPKQEHQAHVLAADVSALNFIAYRQAVVSYVNANPLATGLVTDLALAPYWPPGYIRDNNWTNLVNGSLIYIYSTNQLPSGTVKTIFDRARHSVMIGTKNPVTGRLISANGIDTGITLPAVIPAASLVMMGK